MQNLTDERKTQMVALIREEEQIEKTLRTWQRDLAGCLDDDYAVTVAYHAEQTGLSAAQMADTIQALIDRYHVANDELVLLMEHATPTAQVDNVLFRVPLHMVKQLRNLVSEN